MHYEPLFESYVFVCIPETDITQLRQVDNVVSLLYWMGHPAIIKDKEIEAIKEFANQHHDIKLIRSTVNVSSDTITNNETTNITDPYYSHDGKVLTLKNKVVKVNLPSLGFSMIAEIETDTIIGREVSFGNQVLSLQ